MPSATAPRDQDPIELFVRARPVVCLAALFTAVSLLAVVVSIGALSQVGAPTWVDEHPTDEIALTSLLGVAGLLLTALNCVLLRQALHHPRSSKLAAAVASSGLMSLVALAIRFARLY